MTPSGLRIIVHTDEVQRACKRPVGYAGGRPSCAEGCHQLPRGSFTHSLCARWIWPQLLDCELVVSTSLHGIIFSEAFGIPARWVRDKSLPSAHNDVFKFNDYLLATGRPADLYAPSMKEAVHMGGMPPIGEAMLRCRQRSLMLAFPYHVRASHDGPSCLIPVSSA